LKVFQILVAVSLGCVSAGKYPQIQYALNYTVTVVCSPDCTQSFRLSNRTEFCEEFSLVLECSTVKTAILTAFQGNLLGCNEIVLLHTRFNSPNGTNGTCNSEKVLGLSLPTDVSGNCYTSLLCIMVPPDIVGETVTCISDDGTTMKEIGNYSVPSSTKTTTITPFTGITDLYGTIIMP
jgi:hypothetical protein